MTSGCEFDHFEFLMVKNMVTELVNEQIPCKWTGKFYLFEYLSRRKIVQIKHFKEKITQLAQQSHFSFDLCEILIPVIVTSVALIRKSKLMTAITFSVIFCNLSRKPKRRVCVSRHKKRVYFANIWIIYKILCGL